MHEGKLTRERILDEASKLVHKKGFGATSLNDLLEASGVKKGTLYYHFSDKDNLGLTVLERATENFIATLDEILLVSTPVQSLENFFEYVLNHHREMGFSGGCLFGNTALEMSDTGNPFVESVKNLFDEWSHRIEIVIRAGQHGGQFRSGIPASELAYVIVSTIEGGIMLSRLRKEENPLKTCLTSLLVFLRADNSKTKNFSQSIKHHNKRETP